MRFVIALIALAAAPAVAQSNFGDPALTETPITSVEIGRTYNDVRPNWRQDYMVRLNQLCQSRSAANLRKCEEAWKAINAAYAGLQARKAAGTPD